ncbi:hypothetical protein AB0C86_05545 [Streptomyces lavendulae]|uniref:hypothetical protein n=1 Tax=Streptomyces lavendulae TaxID=1914 RepID=UPI0033CBBA1D
MLRNEPDGRRAGQRRLRARDDPSRPAGGHLADRIGRRPAIVLGLCGYAVAQPAIAASASLATGAMGAGLLAAVLGRWDLRRLFVTDAATCLAAQC